MKATKKQEHLKKIESVVECWNTFEDLVPMQKYIYNI